MRRSVTVFVGVLCGATLFAKAQVNNPGVDTAPGVGQKTQDPVGAVGNSSSRVVIYGWEIDSVTAIKRPQVTEEVPQFQQGRRVGIAKGLLKPGKGQFLIIEVKSHWATSQPPNEPLWIGRPDIVLVDDQGVEYPAVNALARQGGEYKAAGMVSGPNRRTAGEVRQKNSRLLAYFDVPNANRAYSLRFTKTGPLIPVQQLVDLPDPTVDLPE